MNAPVVSAERMRLTDEAYRANGCYPIQSTYHAQRHRWILDRVANVHGGLLLDLGCGDGMLGSRAFEEGLIDEYVGMDYSGAALGLAAQRLAPWKGRYRLVHGDIEDTYHTLPLPMHRADAVAVAEVLEHTEHPKRVLAGACRAARSGGVICVTSPCRYDRRDPLAVSYLPADAAERMLMRNHAAVQERSLLYTDPIRITYRHNGTTSTITKPPRPLSYLIMAKKLP